MLRIRNTRVQSVTKKQLSLILDYMETHEDMCAGKLTPTFTKIVKQARWHELTSKLNSITSADSRECVKTVAKWQRTWIDWRSTLRKKASCIKREKRKGLSVKPLSPLEQRALRLFHKVDYKFSQAERYVVEQDKTSRFHSQNDPEAGATFEGITVKIEDVVSVPESDAASSIVTVTTSDSSTTFTKQKETSNADAFTSSAGTSETVPVAVKKVSTALNNIIFVPIDNSPLFAIQDASHTVLNIPTVSQEDTPKITVRDSLQKMDIPNVKQIINTSTAAPTTSSSVHGLSSKFNSQTTTVLPEKHTRENANEDFETSELPRTRRTEDTLGGLPLNLQNSILERLDTLNRNVETNTCALTILAKAINDSSDTRMRSVNNLAKVISSVGNLLSSSLELLKTGKGESQS